MAETTTFIKLDRNIRSWRWYKDPNTMRVFIDLLLDANISDRDFMGITVPVSYTPLDVYKRQGYDSRIRTMANTRRKMMKNLKTKEQIEIYDEISQCEGTDAGRPGI